MPMSIELRVCPLCFSSLEKHLEMLDTVRCFGCRNYVENNYVVDVEKVGENLKGIRRSS